MSKQEQVCLIFNQVINDLKESKKVCDKDELLAIVQKATVDLNSTYRPLLDGYYDGEYSKEVYCAARDFRETALTYLDYAEVTLKELKPRYCDVREYICEATCWTEKAQVVLCDIGCHSETSDCDKCSTSPSCESCSSSCDSSSSSSCDSSSSSSSCSSSSDSSSSSCSSSDSDSEDSSSC